MSEDRSNPFGWHRGHKPVIAEISAERLRQVSLAGEGFTVEHDDEHDKGELALAAACYASPQLIYVKDSRANAVIFRDPWPWDERWDKRPGNGNVVKHNIDQAMPKRRALLVKAAALIVAEIERLDRVAELKP